jgi:hypothetical protein
MAYYGTIDGAGTYYSTRLNTAIWERSVLEDRVAALTMATAAIDKLNIAGSKADADQELQFPRCNDTVVPTAIERAAYEIVLTLLDGYDQEQEVETLGVLSEAYSGVRTTYDAHYVNEHKRAGIPSSEAWELLLPYLRDPTLMRISRVS